MIPAGILILTIGLILGLGTLLIQMVGVLGFDSTSRWTDPLPTIAAMGMTTAVGLGAILMGLIQLTVL
jgi:hypothetical protein